MHPTISDAVADIVQNAFEAAAGWVELKMVRQGDALRVQVADNGRGMDEQTLKRAMDPFWTEEGKHPGRKVGLGLPFLKQTMDQTGGILEMDTAPGRGTVVKFEFDLTNVDVPPLGDLAETLSGLMAYPGGHEFVVSRREEARGYDVKRSELRNALGGLESAGSLALMKQFFASNEEELVGK
ncbi:MAG: ATP-binding protein [Verrucomicrobiota bacterium]|jgi:hypothetical protein|nr:ATP-binding protein [Verrucomicrobiota bacterium]